MTREEVRRMAAVALEADSGCSVCVRGQFRRLSLAFPEQRDALLDIWLATLEPNERQGELAEMFADLEEGEE